jgi:hypothetical protein
VRCEPAPCYTLDASTRSKVAGAFLRFYSLTDGPLASNTQSGTKTLHQRSQYLYSNSPVPLTSPKRALTAVAVIICLVGAGLGVYLYRQRAPLPGPRAGQPPDLLSQLPGDAPAVGFIDVASLRKLQNSPLAAALGLTSPTPQADREYADFVRSTGFDYTRDLDKTAIAFWPRSLGTPSNILGDDRLLAIAEGRFDAQKIEAYALRAGRLLTRGTRSIYEVPGNPPVSFEFLSPTRIALASGNHAGDLLDEINSSALDPAMRSHVGRVAGAPIFAVARTDNLPPDLYQDFKKSPQLEELVRSVRGLSLAGQPDGGHIQMALDAECDSMKNALKLATLLDGFRMFGSIALSDPKTRRQMSKEQAAFLQSLISRVKVTHQNNWVRLVLDVTPAMLGAAPSGSSDLSPSLPPFRSQRASVSFPSKHSL